MATGENTNGTLAEGLPDIIADARIRAEFEGNWARVTTIERQGEGTGLNWTRTILEKIEAQDITETTTNNNYQRFRAVQIQGEPQMTQIITKVTDRFYRHQAKVVSSKLGPLAGNAMGRKKDRDFIATFAVMNTGASPGAGNALTRGHLAAARSRIRSNTSEPSMLEVNAILRGEQVYYLETELEAGLGTTMMPEGMSEDVYKEGFSGRAGGCNVWTNDNIQTTGTTNAHGAVLARNAMIAVLAMELKTEPDRDIYFGGGADVVSMVDEYCFVEDGGGFWAFRITSDATPPTS